MTAKEKQIQAYRKLTWRKALSVSQLIRGVYPYLPLATNEPRTIFFFWGGGGYEKFNKFQYTKIHIIIAAK